MIIELLTAIGAILAVAVGMGAIYNATQNSKRQIIVGKLEELFETIQTSGMYYSKYMELSSHAFAFKEGTKITKLLKTYGEYYEYRDKVISEGERNQIVVYISRIEVLARCYTKGDLQEQVLKYYFLMSTFTEFVFTGGSIRQEINYKNGFPTYEEFYTLVENCKMKIISQIKI